MLSRDIKEGAKSFSRIRTVNKARFATKSQRRAVKQQAKISLARAVQLPKEFNRWADDGFMPPPMDQGQCGSCFACASCQMLACRFRYAFRSKSLELENLSVQYLIDCYGRQGEPHDQEVEGCDGGVVPVALNLMTSLGTPSDAELPYTSAGCATDGGVVNNAGGGSCSEAISSSDCKNKFAEKIFRARNPVLVTDQEGKEPDNYAQISKKTIEENVAAMKAHIYNRGPVVSVIEVFDDLFDYNGRGVYAHAPTSKSAGIHAISVVGWNESGSRPFWIVQNSWGTSWGDGGFFYVLMYENESLIESEAYGADPDLESPAVKSLGLTNADFDRSTGTEWVDYSWRIPFFNLSFWKSWQGVVTVIGLVLLFGYLAKRKMIPT